MWAFFKVTFLPARSPGPDMPSLKMRPLMPRPLYQVGDSLHVLNQIPTWPPRGPTLASQFRLKEGEQRTWYLSKGWLAMQPNVNAYRA